MSPTDTDTKQISAINNRRRNSCGRVEADSGRATEATRIYHFEVDLQVTGFAGNRISSVLSQRSGANARHYFHLTRHNPQSVAVLLFIQ